MVAQRRMQPDAIVVLLDERGNVRTQVVEISIGIGIDLLPLQRLHEALTTGVVIRVRRLAHARGRDLFAPRDASDPSRGGGGATPPNPPPRPHPKNPRKNKKRKMGTPLRLLNQLRCSNRQIQKVQTNELQLKGFNHETFTIRHPEFRGLAYLFLFAGIVHCEDSVEPRPEHFQLFPNHSQ